uniref:Uncharacterized protein n=1 Tax=Trieres chinensis TaxID=1514140 RepID=A0A7S1ZAC1_TRICV|mmetsp:Transcript_20896/g.42148  ORF Transcript_20896/g.42148 Transcript_20896/m.42148 type:complete len:101 (+) Transcript_20896:222-524(+)
MARDGRVTAEDGCGWRHHGKDNDNRGCVNILAKVGDATFLLDPELGLLYQVLGARGGARGDALLHQKAIDVDRRVLALCRGCEETAETIELAIMELWSMT